MRTRFLHTLYLAPPLFLLLLWIVIAPALMAQVGVLGTLVGALFSTAVSAWCITLFAHALRRDL